MSYVVDKVIPNNSFAQLKKIRIQENVESLLNIILECSANYQEDMETYLCVGLTMKNHQSGEMNFDDCEKVGDLLNRIDNKFSNWEK
jgi:hypothetical protein